MLMSLPGEVVTEFDCSALLLNYSPTDHDLTPQRACFPSHQASVPAPHKPIFLSPGWLKGLPGAFPAQLVCEVTGEHERRKHLRQHQKLLEAVGPSPGASDTPQP